MRSSLLCSFSGEPGALQAVKVTRPGEAPALPLAWENLTQVQTVLAKPLVAGDKTVALFSLSGADRKSYGLLMTPNIHGKIRINSWRPWLGCSSFFEGHPFRPQTFR
jgi:hypothetical protein